MGMGFDEGFFCGMPPFFMLFFLIVMGMIIYGVVTSANRYHKNATSPILTQHGKVITKRTSVTHHCNSNNHRSSSHTYYYVTFETDAGQRIELTISGKEYGMLAEGDCGMVTYQGEWFKQFKREVI
ncbi:DUF2500 domain-containing protein [Clostridium aestuarii]|uniref:DUF2500 domain-containing protein n=1 Tax=Clostridium aestuarii TaxID=338193 RepID=A0ABT4CYN5_9CLOT|nr:DUF2500 domain-containing protein [Clostridium aestuarii]MCY6484091.1 DUF2500 domain-containing protein [Clostridium aestuarii]